MNELINISELSKSLGISTRTLRYYEDIGLLLSIRLPEKQQRYYDEQTVRRINQILILRKMELPVKDIIKIYQNTDMVNIIDIFTQKLNAIDEDIATLTELRTIIEEFKKMLIKNGISNLNTLPTFLDIIENNRYVPMYNDNMDRLEIINQKRTKDLNVRYVDMRPMRVLSSYYKGSERKKFAESEEEFNIEYNRITGDCYNIYSGESFEGISLTKKIPDDCVNDTPFEDYILEGLFIAATTPSALDVGELWEKMKIWLNESEYVEIDDYEAGGNRDSIYGSGSMVNEIHSLQGNIVSVYKWDLYIPIRIKQSAVSKYRIVDEDMTVDEIVNSLTINNKTIIDFDDDIILQGNLDYSENESTFLVTNSENEVIITTKKQFSVPVKIDAIIKLNSRNIFLSFHKGDLVFHDLSGHPDHNIMFKDIATNHNFWISHKNMIPQNEFVHVSWIIEKNFMAIIIDGNVLHYGVNYPYFDIDCGIDSIRLGAPKGSDVAFKSLEITSLL